MAKEITGQPWVFNAAGEFEGYANNAELDGNLNGPHFPTRIFVQRFKIDTGAGGDVLINDSNGGNEILKADSTPANDTLEWPINSWVKGLYIQTLPANATIQVWHGKEGL
jgi:hypothetical protein